MIRALREEREQDTRMEAKWEEQRAEMRSMVHSLREEFLAPRGPSLEEALDAIVRQHYEAKGRLPRSVADVMPALGEAHRAQSSSR